MKWSLESSVYNRGMFKGGEIARETSDESQWLKSRMRELGIESLGELSEITGINKGTLSRYFRHTQRPSIDVIPILCNALQISPETLLKALGVITEPDESRGS